MAAPIVLLTDFGARDSYAGIMKGVIASLSPRALVIDLCHEIPAQDVRAAAFQLRAGAPYFPKNAIFLCVVDPGVGSARKIIWARTAEHQFLAPDNGLLSWLESPILEIRELSNPKLWLSQVSATFQGRDILAPAAGHLSRGGKPAALGPRTAEMRRIPFPRALAASGRVKGEILCVDHFGNAVTNISRAELPHAWPIQFRGRHVGAIRSHYASVPAGASLALFGSSGFLELSVRQGSFAREFKASVGDPVECISPRRLR
ncbi:MAG: SAM-dependent chlorinase/fluorinase [Elusimicrobia bacterium]|nr:SAM-dependent chlorinase/fluorinase [Elusimicrobiota bacterium]